MMDNFIEHVITIITHTCKVPIVSSILAFLSIVVQRKIYHCNYTKLTEGSLPVFVYRLFHEDDWKFIYNDNFELKLDSQFYQEWVSCSILISVCYLVTHLIVYILTIFLRCLIPSPSYTPLYHPLKKAITFYLAYFCKVFIVHASVHSIVISNREYIVTDSHMIFSLYMYCMHVITYCIVSCAWFGALSTMIHAEYH